MNTIALVLKTGGWKNAGAVTEYGPQHVQWLARQIRSHLRGIDHQVVCLSDVDVPGVTTIPLRHNFPGWWSKMELFAHDLGRCLYLDLDTVIVGSLKDLATAPVHEDEFFILSSMFKKANTCNSGVMIWNGNHRDLYEAFIRDAEGNMKKYTTSRRWGDQGFLQDHLGEWDWIQSAFPGQIVSAKVDLEFKKDPPRGTRVVCFHGQPKPWDPKLKLSWIPKLV